MTAPSVASLQDPRLRVPRGEEQPRGMGQDVPAPGLELSSLQGCVEDPAQLSLYPEETETQVVKQAACSLETGIKYYALS